MGWRVEPAKGLAWSLAQGTVIFSDLPDRLVKFCEVKCPDPVRNRYGKHDGRMTGPFSGFWHTHLKDDAVLIYTLNSGTVTLVDLVPHRDLEGKRGARLARKLRNLNLKEST